MYEGWIMDVYPSYEFDTMNVWLWTEDGPQLVTDRFKPCFYVHGSEPDLRGCARRLNGEDGVASLSFTERRLRLECDKLYRVLRVEVDRFSKLKTLSELVNSSGRYSRFQLFDVDLRLAQKYMHAKGIFPMAYVDVGRTYRVRDDVFAMDYELPPLRSVELGITVNPRRPHCGSGSEIPYASYDEPLTKVHLRTVEDGRDRTLESDGDEAELMLELIKSIKSLNTDIIYTVNGDEVVFPYLYHRAALNGLDGKFTLDRDGMAALPPADSLDEDCGGEVGNSGVGGTYRTRSSRRPEHSGKSYFTYGRIAYKPPFYSLKGRLHIDRRSSFIHRESGLYGLIEIARLSCIPLQTMSRLSPGSAISAIQVGQAMREGVLIKWKKNQPELFKSATALLVSDRGGHIFDPCAGVHENVVELDFVSLYPSIIARKNISPETVLCSCCENQPGVPRIPGLGYHVCTKRRGLIPKVVAPIVQRRIVYKNRGGDVNDCRQKMLKWVLVTCFGYTGYRNARFGRIECHESITAYAREMLLDAMETAEEMGYKILHGYVDSLWLKAGGYGETVYSAADVAHKISRRIGIPLELEGHYKWIVFLMNKSTDVGALTRYYGLFSDGTLKVRGIELRQHSTPPLFSEFQSDILDVFKSASSMRELYDRIPPVLRIFESYAAGIQEGLCDSRKLAFNTRISRVIKEYRVFNNQLAALMQLDDEGVEVHPGESVSYVILDSNTHDPYKRVGLADRLDGSENYDREKYLEFLCRTGDSILRPFGLTEDVLAKHLEKTKQTELNQF